MFSPVVESARKKSAGIIKAFCVVIPLLGFTGLAHAQGPGKPGGPPPALPVEAEKVGVESWEQSASAIASLMADESVIVRPEVAGRIKSIEFKEGQAVAKGTVLFRLDAAEYEAQVEQSRTAVRFAEVVYNRNKDLRSRKLASAQEFDEAQAALDDARAKLALDQAILAKMTLVAPFNGIVGVRKVSVGAYVKEGDDLVTLDAINPLKADVRVPEPYISLIRDRQRFSVAVDAYPGETFSGEVFAIDPSVDTASRTILLRGRVPNDRGLLRPGMFAKVSVVLRQIDQAITVPERALVPVRDKLFVYRVVDGKAQMVEVTIGDRKSGKILVTKGLAPEDVVITAGQSKPMMREGAAVMVVGVAAPGAASASSGPGVAPAAAKGGPTVPAQQGKS